MAERNIQKGSDEFQFFQDYWNYYKKFRQFEISEEYWESVRLEGMALMEKYNSDEYVVDVIHAYQKMLVREKNEWKKTVS